jgi:methylenetetrahydrofolate dehydrogenase (NADP+)/methenyltetrahydrofolate cyclohydrolase
LRVGDDPSAQAYQRQISRAFAAHGLAVTASLLEARAGQQAVAERLAALAADPAIDGILLQQPLPPGLEIQPLLEAIPRSKDVEGVHPHNAGLLALGRPAFVPSTPLAGLELLQRAVADLTGKLAVVVGRSPIVGRPMAHLLLRADCTVVSCHTRTRDLPALTRQAELLLVAAGRPGLVTGEMIAPGAVVIDFGTSVVDGKLVGDVDRASVEPIAAVLTPVPGGVGPVTTALLGQNLLRAAGGRLGRD